MIAIGNNQSCATGKAAYQFNQLSTFLQRPASAASSVMLHWLAAELMMRLTIPNSAAASGTREETTNHLPFWLAYGFAIFHRCRSLRKYMAPSAIAGEPCNVSPTFTELTISPFSAPALTTRASPS